MQSQSTMLLHHGLDHSRGSDAVDRRQTPLHDRRMSTAMERRRCSSVSHDASLRSAVGPPSRSRGVHHRRMQTNLDSAAAENSWRRYVKSSLCKALQGRVSFWGASLMAELVVAQLSTLAEVSGLGRSGGSCFSCCTIYWEARSRCRVIHGLATGQLHKLACLLGPGPLRSSRGKLSENGCPLGVLEFR